ncbi:MAG: thioredoxin [Gammaproteobacteria bacterium HGW-Gammaproteobacteria-1]|jgi:thioredoxin-like negative regulator of GroEL|nr:MAG: thioredoxin [Gammaproteobacteria bacterium HGW-Gammaproteobacteria-1]
MIRTLLVSLGLLFATAAGAAERPFTGETFAALQRQGSPVLVFIHADWCPTCKKQDFILGELLQDEAFAALEVLRVDFDGQREMVQSFGVKYQSTLIVFRGGQEVGRSTADTNRASIAALLRQAL